MAPTLAGRSTTRQFASGQRSAYDAPMHAYAARFGWVLLPALLSLGSACSGGTEDEDGSGGGDPGTGGASGGNGGTDPGTGGNAGSSSCGELSGSGTEVSGTIEGEVTWTPEGSPYVVSGNVWVEGDLLLEACTVVQVEEYGSFSVSGTMTARGDSATAPVTFMPLEAGLPWGSIEVESTGYLDLEGTTLEGGGTSDATIFAWGEDQYGLPLRSVRVVDVTITGSAGYGVLLEIRAGFSEDSSGLTIEDSGSEYAPFPISVEAGGVGTLPSLSLSNNAIDEILVVPFRPVETETFPNRGYPYRIRGPLVVARENSVVSSDVSTLTIEPGVTLRMEDYAGSGLSVGNGDGNLGRLVAVGTADEPIRFESALDEPAPADWLGLYFAEPVATGNALEFVEIAHAGGFSGAQGYGCGPIENHASILILNPEPVPAFIENTTIESAGGDTQILLGWDYDADPAGAAQEVLDANTFDESGPACRVSLPQDETSQCPGLDAEPDCL